MHIAPEELRQVKKRLDEEDLVVLGYRFAKDGFCREQRFAAYQEALGDRFVARVIDNENAATGVPFPPHSVVTLHLVDRDGEPTRQAVDEILAFFEERLH